MIIEKSGNLLKATDINAIAHVCNLYCTFGAGFALYLKSSYPEAYAADLKTTKGDKTKLGKVSVGVNNRLRFYNMYAMRGLGRAIRQVDYEYLIECLEKVRDDMVEKEIETLGIPYNMGCVNAGGDWRIVRAIVESVFDNSGVDVVIYRI